MSIYFYRKTHENSRKEVEVGDPSAGRSRRLSLTQFQNGWQYYLPSLIWFTVGYRRRNRSANGCPPTKGLPTFYLE
ncbi:MAG: hypothetical protein LBL62_12655 [Planctomycetaceae bacterium]|nr:hypothetical protein [Planctomycetaceae bacterium]